jgi:eukaryotic-like serine/threonine-protein kinase
MGDVWRATDEVLGREIAVKVLKRELSGEHGFLERFRREARQTAALSHPGIAAVFDYGEEDGNAYLVMELVPGEPLSNLLARDGALPAPVAISLVVQTADALAAAHRAGLVHRDVKPANLLVTPDGTVKVTDFGIARALESSQLTATGTVMGTAQYASPEQISGAATTAASDVYSLGIVAYEMVAGRSPYQADSNIGLAMAHLQTEPAPLPDAVPDALAAVILRALAKDPATRPADGAAFAAELRALPPDGRSTLDTRTRAMPVPVAVDPPTARMGPLALDEATRRPFLDGAGRRRSVLRYVLVGIVGIVAVVLLSTRAANRGDDVDAAVGDTSTTAAAVTDTAPADPTATSLAERSEPTTPTPVTASSAAVVEAPATIVDEASYLGRRKDDVIKELEALGFTVVERKAGPIRDAKNNTVVGVEPTGSLEAGSTITVVVAGGKKDEG